MIWILHWISSQRLPAPPRAARPRPRPSSPCGRNELGRRAEIERNTKFLASVGLLVPPKEALEDDEHPVFSASSPARCAVAPTQLSESRPEGSGRLETDRTNAGAF